MKSQQAAQLKVQVMYGVETLTTNQWHLQQPQLLRVEAAMCASNFQTANARLAGAMTPRLNVRAMVTTISGVVIKAAAARRKTLCLTR